MLKKQNIYVGISSIFTILLLCACASAGNQSLKEHTEMSVKSLIQEGKTTQTDIRLRFDSPSNVSYTDGGLEIWEYELDDVHADGVNYIPIVNLFGSSMSGTKKKLVILFEENGIVKKFSMSESPVAVKTGVFK